MEKPYWVGQSFWIRRDNEHIHWWCDQHLKSTLNDGRIFNPVEGCPYCAKAIKLNEEVGFMKAPDAPAKAGVEIDPKDRKYSFVGRPDFGRIIRENEGADVIIVSREDGLVIFAFNVGHFTGVEIPAQNSTRTLDKAAESCGHPHSFSWVKNIPSSRENLPKGWLAFPTHNPVFIKDLRRIAQAFVRARTGKHTVEVLP